MRWRRWTTRARQPGGRGPGDRLPDDARAALGLQRGDRVLAAARAAGGQWYAATPLALVGAGTRIPWAEVAHAQWLDEEQVLVLDPVPGTFAATRLRLTVPGRLPETVHERVVASIVVSRRVTVPGAGSVRVVARRTGDGVGWQVVPDAGVAADDPAVRRAADQAIRALRAELGE